MIGYAFVLITKLRKNAFTIKKETVLISKFGKNELTINTDTNAE